MRYVVIPAIVMLWIYWTYKVYKYYKGDDWSEGKDVSESMWLVFNGLLGVILFVYLCVKYW